MSIDDIGGEDDLLGDALLLLDIVVKESRGSISSTKATTTIRKRKVIFLRDNNVGR
jgi:hypothetical protein